MVNLPLYGDSNIYHRVCIGAPPDLSTATCVQLKYMPLLVVSKPTQAEGQLCPFQGQVCARAMLTASVAVGVGNGHVAIFPEVAARQHIAIPVESAWIMLEAAREARPNQWMYVRNKPYSSLILVWCWRVTLLCAPQKQPTG